MNSDPEGSIKPSEFQNFCIRDYVAEVRKQDWKKCCPFKFCDSEESTRQADMVLAALILENDDVSDNTPENTEAPNSAEVGTSKVQESRYETPTEMVIDDDDVANYTINEGPLEPALSKVKDGQCQNKTDVTEVAMAAENDMPEENLTWKKPKKFRQLSDILKELAGRSDSASENFYSEFTTENEGDSDDNITLNAFLIKKRGVRVAPAGSGSSKKKRKIEVVEPRLDQIKRPKPPVSENLHGNDSELGHKGHSSKSRTNELDFWITKKHKKSSADKGAPSSLGNEENTFRPRKDSLLLCRHKCNRDSIHATQTVQCTTGRNGQVALSEVRKLTGRTTAILNKNTEMAADCVQMRIMDGLTLSDNESIAVLQLLRLSSVEVQTMTSSKTATKDPTSSVAKCKSSCGLDGVMPPASGSTAGHPGAEVYMINGAGAAQAEQKGSETPVCSVNRNPADFCIANAKNKFMTGG